MLAAPGTVCLLLVAGAATLPALSQQRSEARTDYYKKWAEEDVLYIISAEEKAVFAKLTTTEERDRFIEEFWARRDPDPATSANEFKEEHYRRIQYANERFTSGKPGWRTDRGRFYIKFGKPADIESHVGGRYMRRPYEGGGTTSVFPFERWTYRHIDGIGDNVEVEFVDRSMSGNFELAMDGEEKDAFFNVSGWGNTWAEQDGTLSRSDRVDFRFRGNPNNLDKGETKFPLKRLQDEAYFRFEQMLRMDKPPALKNPKLREVVDSRILYPDPLPAASHTVYYRMSDSEYVAPLSLKIQNRDLSYSSTPDGLLTAKVDLYVRVTGLDRKVYYEFDDTMYSRYTTAEFPKHPAHYSVYQRKLRLPPGRYKVDLLVQSDEGRKSGLSTLGIVIPAPPSDPSRMRLAPITLSHYLTHIIGDASSTRQFVIGDIKVVPAFENVFTPAEKLAVYIQGYGLPLDAASQTPRAQVLFQIRTRDGRVLREIRDERGASLQPAADRVVIAEHLTLEGLEQGKYKISVSVEDRISGQKLTETADFEIAG
jgi:GWxTD domain-containing protein